MVLRLACLRRGHLAASDERSNAVYQRLGDLRQIGQRTLLDLAAFAIALAQEDRRWRRPVRDGVDEHAREESLFAAFGKYVTWTHRCKIDSQKARPHRNFQVEESKKFGL